MSRLNPWRRLLAELEALREERPDPFAERRAALEARRTFPGHVAPMHQRKRAKEEG